MRRAVYRAGEFAQWLFFALRETVWDLDIAKVKRTHGQLTLYLSEALPLSDSADDVLFVPFPETDPLPAADKEAILSKLQCDNAIAAMFETFKQMLVGFASNIEVYSVYVQKPNRLTIISRTSTSLEEPDDAYHHYVLKITMHIGETFAIDMTCAQYGYREIVMPWEVYCEKCGIEIEEVIPFDRIHEMIQPDRSPGDRVRIHLSAVIDEALRRWSYANIPLYMLLKFLKPSYDGHVLDIRRIVYERLHAAFDELHDDDGPLDPFDGYSLIRDRASAFWKTKAVPKTSSK